MAVCNPQISLCSFDKRRVENCDQQRTSTLQLMIIKRARKRYDIIKGPEISDNLLSECIRKGFELNRYLLTYSLEQGPS